MKSVSQLWGHVPGPAPREVPGCMHTVQSVLAAMRKNTARLRPRRQGGCPPSHRKSLYGLFSSGHSRSTLRVLSHLSVRHNCRERTHGTQWTQPQEDRALGYLEPAILVLARSHPSCPQRLGLWADLLWDPPIHSALHAIWLRGSSGPGRLRLCNFTIATQSAAGPECFGDMSYLGSAACPCPYKCQAKLHFGAAEGSGTPHLLLRQVLASCDWAGHWGAKGRGGHVPSPNDRDKDK